MKSVFSNSSGVVGNNERRRAILFIALRYIGHHGNVASCSAA